MHGEIIKITTVATGIKEIDIKLDSKIRFLNGQYVMIAFPENSRTRRSYSVLNYDEESHTISLLVKVAGEFTKQLHESKEGDKLLVFGPFGKFILRNNSITSNDSKNIFIAGGIGIVPLYSMLNKILLEQKQDTNNKYSTYCYYSSRYIKEMALYDELNEISKSNTENVNIKLYFTREKTSDRFSVEEIKKIPHFIEYTYYICGPDEMMMHITDALKSIGINEKNIYTESFVMDNM